MSYSVSKRLNQRWHQARLAQDAEGNPDGHLDVWGASPDCFLWQGLFSVLMLAWLFLPIYIAGQVSLRARGLWHAEVFWEGGAHPLDSP